QDALKQQLKQIQATPAGLREGDAIKRQIRSLGDQANEFRRQGKEAQRKQEQTQKAQAPQQPQLPTTEPLEPQPGSVPATRGFENAPSTGLVPQPNAPLTTPVPPPTATGALRAEAQEAKALAAQFEDEGRFNEAWIKYDAAHKALVRLRRALGQPK